MSVKIGDTKVGSGGATPLAPTKLRNLAVELNDGRQRRVQTEVDRIGGELVFEPLEAQHVETGEDRHHQRLASFRSCLRPECRQRAQVVDDFRRAEPSSLSRLSQERLLRVELAHHGLPGLHVTGDPEPACRVVPFPFNPRERELVHRWCVRRMEAHNLTDRPITNPSDLAEQRPDRTLVPVLGVGVALGSGIRPDPTSASFDPWGGGLERWARRGGMTVQNERAATKDAQGDDLPRFHDHVFAAVDGTFPAVLNDWERTVVEAERARDGFEAWYRNPGSATPASLRIAYQNDEDVWASLQPDFIVVSRRSDGTLGASIVDPHGDHLADARAKIRALAAFAEQFGDRFIRIESVARADDGSLRVLDLADPSARAEVLAFEGGKVTALYDSEHSRPYP